MLGITSKYIFCELEAGKNSLKILKIHYITLDEVFLSVNDLFITVLLCAWKLFFALFLTFNLLT